MSHDTTVNQLCKTALFKTANPFYIHNGIQRHLDSVFLNLENGQLGTCKIRDYMDLVERIDKQINNLESVLLKFPNSTEYPKVVVDEIGNANRLFLLEHEEYLRMGNKDRRKSLISPKIDIFHQLIPPDLNKGREFEEISEATVEYLENIFEKCGIALCGYKEHFECRKAELELVKEGIRKLKKSKGMVLSKERNVGLMNDKIYRERSMIDELEIKIAKTSDNVSRLTSLIDEKVGAEVKNQGRIKEKCELLRKIKENKNFYREYAEERVGKFNDLNIALRDMSNRRLLSIRLR
ncbi:hypothetical protein ROZALSC1DRAFT_20373 [Rozella allomycis CSF55]|uniref:Uncharacterized protein n=1 Tax=Rozella allomycis (strain CSF55) TaxID=988480 RepID=A0A4P9YPQ8_ROZAC|nr:hypothetical protein ROZALSC1DRAFT_20373 [Rozella allomycis CSF55]